VGTNVNAWDFDDGSTGSGPVAVHEYAAEGEYTAVVTATNSSGSLSATTDVTITPSSQVFCFIYLPMTFK
jgi:PKD repeat protein